MERQERALAEQRAMERRKQEGTTDSESEADLKTSDEVEEAQLEQFTSKILSNGGCCDGGPSLSDDADHSEQSSDNSTSQDESERDLRIT